MSISLALNKPSIKPSSLKKIYLFKLDSSPDPIHDQPPLNEHYLFETEAKYSILDFYRRIIRREKITPHITHLPPYRFISGG
jgi:hypothetical protein